MSENDKLTLRVDLRGVSIKRFKALKDRYGLENDTELIRLLIAEEYKRQYGE